MFTIFVFPIVKCLNIIIMLKLKNQFIMAPVKTGYGDGSGKLNDKHLEFYKQRAEFLGAICPEPLYINSGLRELPTQIGIDSENKIEGLKKFTKMLHSYNTKAIAHLNHPGRMANPKIPGNFFISSTNKACENGGAMPKQMDRDDMDEVISQFINAATIAEKSNFDILEIQFGHGYLFSQFISPSVNDRTDEYGGSFENRIKFPLEVLDKITKITNLPIIIRISGDEMLPSGIHMEEMIKLAHILKNKGIEAIHVSAGTVCNTPPWYFQHMFVPKGKTWEMASKIKTEVDIPVVYVGQINETNDIEILKTKHKADYIALGRALVADPDFIAKYLNKKQGLIRPCLACSDGCLGGVKSGKGLGCLVNPTVNYPEKINTTSKTRKKKFAIIGGGLAGCETALQLHQKGHEVSIFEPNSIGGQFDLAFLPPKKQSLKKIINYYKEYLSENKITLINKAAKLSDLQLFDEVIIASGSTPIIPKIEGLKDFFWAEILKPENTPERKNIAIIGGGLIGTEVAHTLLHHHNKVYLIELMDEIARGMEMIERKMTLASFKNSNIEIYTSTKLVKVNNRELILEKDSKRFSINNIDHIVLATGMKAYHPFEEDKINIPFHYIGDANKVRKAQNAIREAFDFVNKNY